jgi:hypothetical protein
MVQPNKMGRQLYRLPKRRHTAGMAIANDVGASGRFALSPHADAGYRSPMIEGRSHHSSIWAQDQFGA